MDPSLGFSQLLGLAQGNQSSSNTNNVRLLKTEFKTNKKDVKKDKKLNAGVQKFLENKEKEEKQKRIEEKLRLQNLNDLRSDRAKNKIAKHLKVTKSANKAVLDEAHDKVHTAVTRNGRTQCDEDDYGFESKAGGELYEKLMSKFEANPDDPMAKFSKSKPKEFKDLAGAKERMKQSLREEELNPMIPGKKRRRTKAEYEASKTRNESSEKAKDRYAAEMNRREEELRKDKKKSSHGMSAKEKEKEEARKRRLQMNAKKAPPTMDFQSLMQMANFKKDVPIQVEKKVSKKDSEFGDRPMTKQEKEEYIRENKKKLIKEGKLSKSPPRPTGKAAPSWDDHVSEKMVKSKSPAPKFQKAEPGPMFHSAVKKSMPPPSEKKKDELERERVERERKEIEEKMRELTEKREEMERKSKELEKTEKQRAMERKMLIQNQNEKRRMEFERKEEERKRKEIKEKQERRKFDNERKELDDMQSKYKEMQKQMKEMEKKLQAGSSKGPRDISSVESRAFPGEKKRKESSQDRRKGGGDYKRRIESDSEDEYDSEMDDFIDDGEEDVDIGAQIRSIFGYDKRRYKDEDFDDRSMENNKFSSIMMEEARSARIGRQEDLEDMRREEEENRRKSMKKKR